MIGYLEHGSIKGHKHLTKIGVKQNQTPTFKNVGSLYHNMPTPEDKIKINARIPKSLYDWIGVEYGNVSQAVNESLELLKESQYVSYDTEAHKSPTKRLTQAHK